MPKLILTLPDTSESIMRPVVLDVVRQLFDYTGISPQTNLSFPGDLQKGKQLNTSIGLRGEDDPNMTAFDAKVSIEIEEDYDPDRLLATAIHRPENIFIFRDERIQTYIKPAYSATDMTINFRLRSVDKNSANRWRDEIRARIADRRAELMHTLTYHYLIPPEYLKILEEIHRLRENVLPYGETYEEYLTDNTTSRLSTLTNLAGKHPTLAIGETQVRVQGWFDFDGTPEKGERDGDMDSWTISFSYKFRYDKPLACIMHYPLMIHNQVLSTKFRPAERTYDLEENLLDYSESGLDLRYFERGGSFSLPSPTPGIAIPDYDEFIPGKANIIPSTMRLFTGMVSLDLDNPTDLMSMKTLSWWKFHPLVEAFLANEATFMVEPYKSIFVLSLYKNQALLPSPCLTVNPTTLDIASTVELSGRNCHHLRLSLVTDLDLLTESAIDRLRNNAAVTLLLLQAIDPTITNSGKLPAILGTSYIGRKDMKIAIDYINRGKNKRDYLNKEIDLRVQFNTVMTLFITTQLRD